MFRFISGGKLIEVGDCIDFELDNLISPFLVETSETPDIRFTFAENDEALLSSGKKLQRTGGYELLRLPSGRLFLANHWGRLSHAWGFYPDELNSPSGSLTVFASTGLSAQPAVSATRFLSTAGLHGLLLRKNCPIIHASFISHKGRGIIFTAPSGTGKSTQADLWVRHAGAEIINGDRVLLSKKDGVWHACGYPCCGSSRICLARDIPLAAVVVLSRGKENRVSPLTLAQKIRALVSGTEVFPWDRVETDLAFSLAAELCSDVPVLGLACTPDGQAVETLRNFLEDEKNGIRF
ncbi:MAG: hypothetical protein IJY86_10295 [Clostridia bacterium]|nr:hypothetical protein [Clostridia bacterium]